MSMTGGMAGSSLASTVSITPKGYPNVINVKDATYGAVGDGIASDRAAINAAAIAAANADLFFPPGTYLVDSNLTIGSTVRCVFSNGAVLKVATGVIVTINGPVEAPLSQVFFLVGTGSVAFAAGKVEKLYPQWWGARGDGATDDTTSINASILASSGVAKLFFSKGTYIGKFTLASDLILEGEGELSMLKRPNGAATGKTVDGTGKNNIIVRNLTVDGNSANQTPGQTTADLFFSQSTNILVENCTFLNAIYQAVSFDVAATACKRVRVLGCRFDTCLDAILSAAQNAVFADNYFRAVTDTCIDISGFEGTVYAKDTVVVGNQMDGPAVGVIVARKCTNVAIVGNVINDATNVAIDCTKVTDTAGPTFVVISGNSINGSFNYGITVGYSKYVVVANNVVNGVRGGSPAQGINLLNCDDSDVSGNAVIGSGQVGIELDNGNRCAVMGNVILNSGLDATFKSGIVLFNMVDSLCVGNQASDNQGTHTQNRGIEISTSCSRIQVRNNTCVGNLAYGILVSGASATNIVITDNYVNNNPTAGIGDQSTANSVVIARNDGFNPLGQITNPFDTTNNLVRYQGGAAAPVASVDYVVQSTDVIINSTGGTGVSISVKAPSGVAILSGLATLAGQRIPRGYKINFGAFSVAPTVTVFGE